MTSVTSTAGLGISEASKVSCAAKQQQQTMVIVVHCLVLAKSPIAPIAHLFICLDVHLLLRCGNSPINIGWQLIRKPYS
jgi:hypothetical protein